MSRFKSSDVVLELLDLCQELRDEIRQQLTYYRASVYKTETAEQINHKVGHLRTVSEIFHVELINDAFRDYDYMVNQRLQSPVPGECSLTFRVARLFEQLTVHYTALAQDVFQRRTLVSEDQLARSLKEHQRALLAICKHGSRSWNIIASVR